MTLIAAATNSSVWRTLANWYAMWKTIIVAEFLCFTTTEIR